MQNKTNPKSATVLSQEAVTKLQMVEGLAQDTLSLHDDQDEIQDMSVGWYSTPQSQRHDTVE